MEHRKIARLLELAGALALLLVIFVFFIYAPLYGRTDSEIPEWAPTLFMAAAGLPYLAAIVSYFKICANIGRDRSFCRENVRWMRRISQFLLAAAGLWLLTLLGFISGLIPRTILSTILHARLAAALAMLASLAVALVARMLAYLLDRAGRLQEESDLTI